jgi:hypothetical protein
MVHRALLVDPDDGRLDALRRGIGHVVDLTTCTRFWKARQQLLTTHPALLISNIRLGPHNGLHLAHLAAFAGLETRCVVYDEPADLHLIREAQRIGAFYERTSRLAFAIPSYLRTSLPDRDRRYAESVDRRGLFRGGRRTSDVAPDHIRTAQSVSH